MKNKIILAVISIVFVGTFIFYWGVVNYVVKGIHEHYQDLSEAEVASKGAQYLEQGFYPDAVEAFSKAVDLDPQNENNYFNRGLALSSMADYDQAIKDFSKVIELNPSNGLANMYRGLQYFQNEQFDQGLRDFNQAIALNPQNPEAYFYRGKIYQEKKDYPRALKEYDLVIGLDPYNAEAYYQRAEIFFKLEKIDEVKENVEKARALGLEVSFESVEYTEDDVSPAEKE